VGRQAALYYITLYYTGKSAASVCGARAKREAVRSEREDCLKPYGIKIEVIDHRKRAVRSPHTNYTHSPDTPPLWKGSRNFRFSFPARTPSVHTYTGCGPVREIQFHLSFVICHLSFVICHLSFVIIPKPYNDLEGAKPRALAKKMTNDKWQMKENFAVCAPVSEP
jgi:hypothetical protein